MTDIQFAKEHMGEYFQFRRETARGVREYEVRVIGYDAIGAGDSVIIDYIRGWEIQDADLSDIIYEGLCKTGRCYYVKWEDLK